MQKLTRICSSDSLHFGHCLLCSVCCISLVASVMLSIYAKLSSHLLVSERESGSNMQGTVFTLASLKIVPSYRQELVSHPMPENIEALT